MTYITQNIPITGGLASQIQQYATLVAIAKKTNKKIIFSDEMKNNEVGFQFNRILDINIEFKPNTFFGDFETIEPKSHLIVDKDCFNLDENKNYYFKGRFDLYHYWYDSIYNDVLNWNWNSKYYDVAKSEYDLKYKTRHDIETVSIHIRRGDYLLSHHHHFCRLDSDYYSNAIEKFNDGKAYNFLIFSNDIEYAKMLFNESDNVFFIEPGDSDYGWTKSSDKGLCDLILMSLCDHNIIANSSYSWWAALKNKNKNKKIVCPKNYLMNYSFARHINENYYPDNWIAINNKN